MSTGCEMTYLTLLMVVKVARNPSIMKNSGSSRIMEGNSNKKHKRNL